jgi:hypothetical protein
MTARYQIASWQFIPVAPPPTGADGGIERGKANLRF